MNDGIYYPSRREQTNAILRRIQDSEDDKERQKWAWEVVLLNDAASTWLAKRFCPVPNEDDVSEARMALYDAALYCDPAKGSSYLSVACWYFMRRTTGKRTGAGIHVPANTAQLMSRVKSWMAKQTELNSRQPTLAEALKEFSLSMSEMDLHIAMWAVSNPKGEGSLVFNAPCSPDDDDASRYDFSYVIDEVDSRYDLEKLDRALHRLSSVEKAAVLTYGGDSPPLRVVGEEHGISREWVNQTRKKALRNLRGSLRVPQTDA